MVVAVAAEPYPSVGFFSNLIDELDASVPIESFEWRQGSPDGYFGTHASSKGLHSGTQS